MNKNLNTLINLTNNEKLALGHFIAILERDFENIILQVIVYGSAVRGKRSADSDIDLLIITETDDWKVQEPIRFLAARVSNEYDVFLSAFVVGLTRLANLKNNHPVFYQNIRLDGIEVLRLGRTPNIAVNQPQTA